MNLEEFLKECGPVCTWRQLAFAISMMTAEQMDSGLTVELEHAKELLPAELMLCEGKPVIFTNQA